MKKSAKLLLTLIVTITLVFLLISCSEKDSSLKSGLYVSDDSLSFVEIDTKDLTFTFQRGATSYRPSGKYIIDKDRLLMLSSEDSDQIDFEFMITDTSIVFQRGELAESIVEKGSVFTYQNNASKN